MNLTAATADHRDGGIEKTSELVVVVVCLRRTATGGPSHLEACCIKNELPCVVVVIVGG